MAVIITNMDMPSNCYECELNNYHCCDITGNSIEKYTNIDAREKECPLKSIDGLAEAIEQFPFTYGFASEIEREINKYCDKEKNKDD